MSLTHFVRPKLVCSWCTTCDYKLFLSHHAFTTAGQLTILQKTSSSLSSLIPMYHREFLLSFFFSLVTLRTPEICFHILGSDHFTPLLNLTEHALIRVLGKVHENISLVLSQIVLAPSTWQTEGFTSMKHSSKDHLQEITMEALTLYFKLFSIDKSLWDPCSWRANMPGFLRTGPWAAHLSDHRWLDSDQQYHVVQVHAFVYDSCVMLKLHLRIRSPTLRFSTILLDSSEYKTL